MNTDSLEGLVHIGVDNIVLEGNLEIPDNAKGIVLFAHGSGSSRHSPRNNYVAKVLREGGLGTLLLDLLTEEEDLDYERRFDINLLAHRLILTTQWLETNVPRNLAIGYFGASTGAAAALKAAATLGNTIGAVVSRGGRPDLAEEELHLVVAPTLLMVGGSDDGVIQLNQQAYEKLETTKELTIIPGATHLFEEPGALEKVAILAKNWFNQSLTNFQR